MSLLQNIMQDVKKELSTIRSFSRDDLFPSSKDFLQSIKKIKGTNLKLVAEFKRRSPSDHFVDDSYSMDFLLHMYEQYASAISILTNKKFFGGSLDDLKEASKISSKPLLRKDFIIDPLQVEEARYFGADAYLLIVQVLSSSQLQELILAGKEWNMLPLIEIHSESELDSILSCGDLISTVGINNRNLHDLSIDLSTTSRILNEIPLEFLQKWTFISESGLLSKENLEQLPKQIDAVLMGTVFMQTSNPKDLLESWFG